MGLRFYAAFTLGIFLSCMIPFAVSAVPAMTAPVFGISGVLIVVALGFVSILLVGGLFE